MTPADLTVTGATGAVTAPTLKPCPFCGGEAEFDSRQSYRNISHGRIEHAAAVYCTSCSAAIVICYADHRGEPREVLQRAAVCRWNRRGKGANCPPWELKA